MPLKVEEIAIDAVQTDETVREPNRRLLSSLETHGLFSPIHVRDEGDGAYHLIDGSRRLAAARQLGWKTIAALIEPADETQSDKDLKAIVLNTQRKNLQQLHIARHAHRLVHQDGRVQADLAREINLGKSTLSTMLKILDSPDLIAALEQDGLEFGAVKALSALATEERAALLEELRQTQQQSGRYPSVRDIERLVRKRQGRETIVPPAAGSLPGVIEALRGRGNPITVRVGLGKQTQARVVLTVSEADRAWYADLIQVDGE